MNNNRKYPRGQQEADVATVVKAWLKGLNWAKRVEGGLDAEQKWEFIIALVAAAPDNDALGSIGAGPLKDLLYGNNEKFRFSLSIVRNPVLILKNPNRKEEIQQRMKSAVRTDENRTTENEGLL